MPSDARLARVSCSTTGGTADINLYERAPGSPNAGNTGMLLADLVCDPDGEAVECDPTGVDLYDCSAVFLDDRLSQDALLTLGIKAVAAPPGAAFEGSRRMVLRNGCRGGTERSLRIAG